jgi:hypothetical protein
MQFRAVALLVAMLSYATCTFAQDITLVKHARRPQSLKPKTPQPTQQYVVKEGDTLSDILFKAYGAKKQDMPALFAKFRKENPWIQDLNYIQAGAKVSIPALGKNDQDASSRMKTEDVVQVKQVSPDIYVVKQGQHLARILRKVYGVPDDLIFHQYLQLVMEMNPEISDPDHLVPGQKLKLPSVKQVLASAQSSRNTSLDPVLATTTGIPDEKPPSLPVVSPSVAEKGKAVETSRQSAPVSPQPARRGDRPRSGLPNLAQGSSPGTQPMATQRTSAETVTGKEDAEKLRGSQSLQTVKSTVLPALERMGGKQKNQGTYFMPLSGGTNISLNTNEIPVMELDTGKKIIFDTNNKITPEMKGFIERAFPSFKVISGSPSNLEEIMDKVLSVSGYFSVNKDPSPLLVGEEEKLRFSGKWVVYKDFSRRNTFVINILADGDNKTPALIRSYAGRFGIDLIELGGRDPVPARKNAGSTLALNRSYKTLFDHIKVDYKTEKEIELISGTLRVAYRAPILVGNVILTETMPDQTMLSILMKKSFVVVNTRTESLDRVLRTIGLKAEGPPIKIPVAAGRTELEIPALRVGPHLILKTAIDKGIASYIASSGEEVLSW